MVWIEKNEAGFQKMLNQPGIQRYLYSQGVRAQGIFRGVTKRSKLPKDHNADTSKLRRAKTYKGATGDRPEVSLTATQAYSLQREEGGTRNGFPEHSLKAAIGKAAATGGGGPVGRSRNLDRRYMSGSYLRRKSAAYDELDGKTTSRYMDIQRARRMERINQSASAKRISRKAYRQIDADRARAGKPVLEWKWT